MTRSLVDLLLERAEAGAPGVLLVDPRGPPPDPAAEPPGAGAGGPRAEGPGIGQPGAERPALALAPADVLALARRASAALRAAGVGPGDRVLLALPTGPAFLAAFWGTLLLGATPAPTAPPDGGPGARARLQVAAAACRPRVVVLERSPASTPAAPGAGSSLAPALGAAPASAPAPTLVPADALWAAAPEDGARPARGPGLAPALVQLTSGSTARPRATVISHAAALACVDSIVARAGWGPADPFVSWLPLHHDLGLVGMLLGSLVVGAPLVLLPPERFLARPRRWLELISTHRGAISAGPNFAYALCATHLGRDGAASLAGLDLASWRHAIVSAEPVLAGTLARFAAALRPAGFRPEALATAYGLAEFTVGATGNAPGTPPRVDVVDRAALERAGRAVPCAPRAAGEAGGDAAREDADLGGAHTRRVVSCGRPLPGVALRVVGPDGAPRGEREVGEVELRGPARMDGYLDAPDETAAVLRDGWLRTGDLGYVADGELFVTGRSKERILRAGVGIDPADVEAAAAGVEGARKGGLAAVGLPDAERGTERLVLVAETALEEPAALRELTRRLRAAALAGTGHALDEVVLARPRALPRTTSGKLRRRAVAAALAAGRRPPAPGAPEPAGASWTEDVGAEAGEA